MATLAFDPNSRAARRLARTWLPHLERWEVKIREGHCFVDHGRVIEAGSTIEVARPHGRQLIDRGSAELVGIRRIAARA